MFAVQYQNALDEYYSSDLNESDHPWRHESRPTEPSGALVLSCVVRGRGASENRQPVGRFGNGIFISASRSRSAVPCVGTETKGLGLAAYQMTRCRCCWNACRHVPRRKKARGLEYTATSPLSTVSRGWRAIDLRSYIRGDAVQ